MCGGCAENSAALSADVVRIIVTDHQDRRPVEDILCTDEAYQAVYREAGVKNHSDIQTAGERPRTLQVGERNENSTMGDLRLEAGGMKACTHNNNPVILLVVQVRFTAQNGLT